MSYAKNKYRWGKPGAGNKLHFLFALLLLICNSMFAQSENPYSEKIFLHTDRDYYISGEDVRFKAYINPGEGTEIQSKVLYVELKDVVQNRIEYLAFLINENQVSGNIPLADSLRSGSYTLSAFTNWHKNYENRYAFRKELILINRFGTTGPMGEKQAQPPETSLHTTHNIKEKNILSVETDQATYSTRSPVRISFSLQEVVNEISSTNLSVTVFPIPENYPINTSSTITDWFNLYSEIPSPSVEAFDEHSSYKLIYPIEADGRIISGKVISAKSESPVPGALVFFSFMDTLAYLDYDHTDSLGNFYINVPSGMHCDPGIVQVWQLPEGIDRCRIRFEDKEEIKPPGGSSIKEVSGEELHEIFATQVKVFELSKLFEENPASPVKKEDTENNFKTMYAGYNLTVYPSDFVRLYNFHEIAREILPGVQLKTEEDGISIRIMDESRNIYFDNEPLVLVNGLPLKSYNFLATLSSDDIAKIDIVRRLFVAGNLIFPGVLSISLKGEIKPEYLEANKLYRVNSAIITQSAPSGLGDGTKQHMKSKRQPDLRNTLLWIPEMKMNSGEKQILFYTADQEGKYRISVEGLVNGNIPVSANHEFTIKANY